ncbi:hypothetical protein EmuJ_000870000 [Echinococcus multilocularis]|uniref:Uncharacterized protein n=1 Tax=Echinococcus multilocularis TaxID=6211 RepID=A0A068YFG1_ECHMU|nr:hypothetical protein EmuJ_000870000 [Echinococcus multilocularis]
MATLTKKRCSVEKLEDMKAKLRHLDGDSKAYYETSVRYIEEAKAKIYSLRNEIQDLRHEYNEHLEARALDFCFHRFFK